MVTGTVGCAPECNAVSRSNSVTHFMVLYSMEQTMISRFTKDNFIAYCNQLAGSDADLHQVIQTFGYPPFWSRTPTFPTLVHIILEQQVSLASAKAAFLKLEATIGQITPEKILQLDDADLKACYFSRQKTGYVRHLSTLICSGVLDLDSLNTMDDAAAKSALKQVKGIGDWTADVFLMMALHRTDCFPTGDIALMNSVKAVKRLPADISKETVLELAEQWRPLRTIAAYLLWHAYLEKRKPA